MSIVGVTPADAPFRLHAVSLPAVSLPSMSLAALFSDGRRHVLAPGDALFRQSDPADRLFLIEHGRARMVRHPASGQAVTMHMGQAGELFAEGALFAVAYHCDGVAAEATTVVACPKADVLALVMSSPSVALDLLEHVVRQLRTARTVVELRGIRSASGRVLRHLQLRADAAGVVRLEGPLLELAAELGLSHEACCRALATLARQGTIQRSQRRIPLL